MHCHIFDINFHLKETIRFSFYYLNDGFSNNGFVYPPLIWLHISFHGCIAGQLGTGRLPDNRIKLANFEKYLCPGCAFRTPYKYQKCIQEIGKPKHGVQLSS